MYSIIKKERKESRLKCCQPQPNATCPLTLVRHNNTSAAIVIPSLYLSEINPGQKFIGGKQAGVSALHYVFYQSQNSSLASLAPLPQ